VATVDGEQQHVVRSGWGIDLVFVDQHRARTAYQVVYRPATAGAEQRFSGRTREAGSLSRIHIRHAGRPSKVSVRWLVRGRTKARWVFLIRPRQRRR
jgi:hypothetical protein